MRVLLPANAIQKFIQGVSKWLDQDHGSLDVAEVSPDGDSDQCNQTGYHNGWDHLGIHEDSP
jgi:hypothetical protein